jgi:hypothetical protein
MKGHSRRPYPRAVAASIVIKGPTLRCAGYGIEGRAPTIACEKRKPPDDPLPVLVPLFGWHEDGRPAMPRKTCERRLVARPGRQYRREPGARHLTK